MRGRLHALLACLLSGQINDGWITFGEYENSCHSPRIHHSTQVHSLVLPFTKDKKAFLLKSLKLLIPLKSNSYSFICSKFIQNISTILQVLDETTYKLHFLL